MPVQVLELQYLIGGQEEPSLEKLVVAFERGGEELRDFGKYLWPKLTPVLESATAEQIDAEGEGPRGQFAPLSARYAAWKEANYPGHPILKATGALYEGLTNSGSAFAARRNEGNSYAFGTQSVTYASYHQTGTQRMLARPFFDFGPGFETELSRAGSEAMRDALKQARIDEVANLSGFGGDA